MMAGKRRIIREVLYHLSRWTYPFVSDWLFNNALFYYNCRRLGKPFYIQNLKQPRTFNEKISWIKFNQRHPLAPVVADKLKVKKWVSEKIGKEYVIPTLKIFSRPEEISLEDLPEQFILKLNTGSGCNLICADRNRFDIQLAKSFFKKSIRVNPFYLSREWHYREIAPLIFAEPLLGENIPDYKFFCSNGTPFMVQVDTDRFLGHKRNFYDLKWKPVEIELNYPPGDQIPAPPENFDLMIQLATVLGGAFGFSRIDFYETNNRIYFGEITLHPGGGVEPFANYEQDLKMGTHVSIK